MSVGRGSRSFEHDRAHVDYASAGCANTDGSKNRAGKAVLLNNPDSLRWWVYSWYARDHQSQVGTDYMSAFQSFVKQEFFGGPRVLEVDPGKYRPD